MGSQLGTQLIPGWPEPSHMRSSAERAGRWGWSRKDGVVGSRRYCHSREITLQHHMDMIKWLFLSVLTGHNCCLWARQCESCRKQARAAHLSSLSELVPRAHQRCLYVCPLLCLSSSSEGRHGPGRLQLTLEETRLNIDVTLAENLKWSLSRDVLFSSFPWLKGEAQNPWERLGVFQWKLKKPSNYKVIVE